MNLTEFYIDLFETYSIYNCLLNLKKTKNNLVIIINIEHYYNFISEKLQCRQVDFFILTLCF